MELFSHKIWRGLPVGKIRQVMWMNSSPAAGRIPGDTTNTSKITRSSKLASEYPTGQDDLISHRARPPVVRRSRHLQGLGRRLAQRRLSHVSGNGWSERALRPGSRRITSAGCARNGEQAAASGKTAARKARLRRFQRVSTATLRQSGGSPHHASHQIGARMLLYRVPQSHYRRNRGKKRRKRRFFQGHRRSTHTITSTKFCQPRGTRGRKKFN